MWRLGTLSVLLVIFCCSSSVGHENGQRIQRVRRSPHYPCPPYFYESRPRHFPGPPPFWPPPPPHQQYFQERQNYENDLQPQNFNQNHQNQHSQAYSDATPAGPPAIPQNQGEIIYPESKPCDKCEKGQSTAISNAKSDSGSAVAVAIAGKANNAGQP